MITIKLAIRNLVGAGLRTWLNVSVLSFAFVVIVFYNGMLDGWNMQAHNDTRDWETGGGQFWHPLYDPFDPFTLQDAHGKTQGEIAQLISKNELTPVLIVQGSIYPQGRMKNVMIKGIDLSQKILRIPTQSLQDTGIAIPALIGKRMAESAKLKKGDVLLMQWRDKYGTFDAREITVTEVFHADVPTVDNGQVWIPLEKLREMTGMEGEATYLIAAQGFKGPNVGEWQFKSSEFLLKEIDEVIQSKKSSSAVIYLLLLSIALLAIFDTQVLAIFRRQREIGTYIALGMTRFDVVKIFTVEGAAHSIFALFLGAAYGIPLLWWLQKHGIPMPASADSAGLAIAEKIIPAYSAAMILSTILLVVISATIVSYFPTRRISKMKPTDALKGKIQ
jgi:ABC-type lipoprotein release transport system permease subunit